MTRRQPNGSIGPAVVPFFLPNAGCASRCVYCDQTAAAGPAPVNPGLEELEACLRKASTGSSLPVEAAFYGATFTGLPRARQAELLDVTAALRAEGLVARVRISTHPAHLDSERLSFLRERGVDVIELGIQSFSDRVLSAAGRGITGAAAADACRRVKEAGFETVVQLMPFLPESTLEEDLESAGQAALLQPDAVRIFPTLVLRGTPLAALLESGRYRPASLVEATLRVGKMLAPLFAAGIPVLRIGLQPSEKLEQALVAGPYHPALGELCRATWLASAIEAELRQRLAAGSSAGERQDAGESRTVSVPRELASLLAGHGKFGLAALENATGGKWRVQVEKEGPDGGVAVPIGDNLSLKVYTAGVRVEKEPA